LTPIRDSLKVASLFSTHGRFWDEERVRALFAEDVAEQILQLPISRHDDEDFISWPHTKHGGYTVRSAYNFARHESAQAERSGKNRGMSSDNGAVEKSWKALWAINAPGKMLITLWRFAHNCLPSGQQLLRRRVPCSPSCIHCSADETVEHALLFCPFARAVWDGVKERFGIQLGRKCFSTPKKWLFDFLARCSGDEATTLAVTFWHLWDARNKLREEGGTIDPSSVARKVNAYIDMIQTHMIQANSIPRRETSAAVSWSPPMEGKLMINVDAALFKTSQSMGMGFLVRGHSGDCMLARCDKISNITSPEMAEALAVRGALSFAKEEGLDNFICASDCLSVVQRVSSPAKDRSTCGAVIEDIKRLLSSFQFSSIIHVFRSQNVAAHVLAHFVESSSSFVWRGVSPDCIKEAICKDSMVN
jgi:ribonuclease HI